MSQPNPPPSRDALTSGEVARMFRVHLSTVKRWAEAGHLTYFRTPGGQYRFPADAVRALKASTSRDATPPAA